MMRTVAAVAVLMAVAARVPSSAYADKSAESAESANSADKTANSPKSAKSANSADDKFDAAVANLAKQEFAAAARLFVAVADDAPKHRLADDALFAAGKLYEERLGDPRRALMLYRRLLSDYEDSREALAAKRRARELVKAIGSKGTGAAALAAYTDVLQRFHLRPEHESITRMKQVVADHRQWPGLARAMLWLGTRYERINDLTKAQKWYLAAAAFATSHPSPNRDQHLFDAYRGAGEVAAKREQYDQARSYYQLMPVGDEPSKYEARKQLLDDVRRKQRRATYYIISIVLLVLLCIGGIASVRTLHASWPDAARAILRPPTEAIFMLPIAAILTIASLSGHHPTAIAVTIVSIGGIVITWLSGAALAGPKPSRRRVWLHIVGTAIAAVCLCYVALHVTNLIDQLMNVLRLGPDVS